jgi:hypothetical protein
LIARPRAVLVPLVMQMPIIHVLQMTQTMVMVRK